jgi:hypothetical protein
LLLASAAACSGKGRPDPSALVEPRDSGSTDEDIGITPAPSTCDDFCGETFLHQVTTPPNLYFLVDRSGSMGEIAPGASLTKYKTARKVIGDLLKVIGHRVRYGASIFPAVIDGCGAGYELRAPELGALPTCDGALDPGLRSFLIGFGNFAPGGSTPTAAALAELRPELEGLEGDTYVILITDGVPNCNPDAVCGIDECTLNIEGRTIGHRQCTPDFNCCDAELTTAGGPGYCVDVAATEYQIRRLAAHGIPTYVVGMPGAETYADVLAGLAEAGGTARDTGAEYYAVEDQDELEQALYDIGTGVAISCSIELDAPPDDPSLVNVYFDGEVVPADPDDGWSWDGDTEIRVNGAACDRLKSGNVIDARAVFGCDTVVR